MCECSFINYIYALFRGYTAPEYVLQGQLSEKADTYSYGIVVLEIISGQKSTDVKVDDDGDEEYLLRRVRNFPLIYTENWLFFLYNFTI